MRRIETYTIFIECVTRRNGTYSTRSMLVETDDIELTIKLLRNKIQALDTEKYQYLISTNYFKNIGSVIYDTGADFNSLVKDGFKES